MFGHSVILSLWHGIAPNVRGYVMFFVLQKRRAKRKPAKQKMSPKGVATEQVAKTYPLLAAEAKDSYSFNPK